MGDPDGDPLAGSPEPLASVGMGGGGLTGGWFWNTRMASRIATAAISSINSHDTNIEIQPALSVRPGHGRGHSLVAPWEMFSDQWSL